MDDLDAKIVTLLHGNGRMTNTEVARRLGVTEATVRKRVARLLRDQVVQFQAWVDPLKVGFQIYSIIDIQVEPREVERVAERLARFPEIAFLGIRTGQFDIFAAAVFRSNDHLYSFLTQQLNRVPGVRHTETANIMRIVKREYRFAAVARELGTGSSR